MRLFSHHTCAYAVVAFLASSHLASIEGQSSDELSAVFNNTLLTVTGTGAGDNIVVSAEAASGNLQVLNNGQSVPIVVIAGIPTKANLALVSVDARGGNDTVVLDRSLNTGEFETLAAAPNGALSGGAGADTLASSIGGRVGNVDGNPIVGNVIMEGGAGNDRLISGFGNDLLVGGPGDDTLTWRASAVGDRLDGGGGHDVAEVFGFSANFADSFRVRPDPASPRDVLVEQTNLVPVVIFISQVEAMALRTQSGDDTVILAGLAGTSLEQVSVDGGEGNDVITGFSLFGDAGIPLRLEGGAGEDTLTGGSGNDFLDGGHPRFDPDLVIEPDTLRGGPGADLFRVFIGDDTPDFNPAEGDFDYSD